MTRYVTLLTVFGGLVACTKPEPSSDRFVIEARVVDDRGLPLSRTNVTLDGSQIGTTDSTGRLLHRLGARGNRQGVAAASCSSNYQSGETTSRVVTFTPMRGVTDAPATVTTLAVTLVCNRRYRSLALVVVSNASEIPVIVDGVTRGVTNQYGVAHVAIDGEVGQEVQVVLDTTTAKKLRPIAPQRSFVLDRDRWEVLEQDFVRRQRKPRRRRARAAVVRRPVLID